MLEQRHDKKLAIVIPAFNAEATIVSTIASARRLTSQVIVVDDGSTDSTARLAMAAGATLHRQANAGAAAARTNGIAATSSEYIILLDADDELLSAGVNESIRLLDMNSQAAVAGGGVLGLYPNGDERTRRRTFNQVTLQTLLTIGYSPWPPAAAVIRRAALLSAGALDVPQLRTDYAEDYELLIRLCSAGSIVLAHSVPSVRYRLFVGKSNRVPVASIREKERIRLYYGEALRVPVVGLTEREILGAAYNKAARSAFTHGDVRLGVKNGLLVVWYSPVSIVRKGLSRVRLGFNRP